ncbi:MAG: DUF456 domain-containing protein [Akkermansia sp.]
MLDFCLIHYDQILIWALVLTLIGAGLAGCVIPFIPGHLFMFIGIIIADYFIPTFDLAWYSWIILSLLCLIGSLGDNLMTAWGAHKFGSTKSGIWGSLIGLILGVIILPGWGLLIGPFVGAVTAELIISRQQIRQSLESGFGAFIGSISGILLKISTGVILFCYFGICFLIWLIGKLPPSA